MKINTITCHDVYNVGASLQAYALVTYLKSLGHHAEIIDYKPDYLCRHYRFDGINNEKYDKPVLRQLYLIAKFPGRCKALLSRRKAEFDRFSAKKLTVTKKRYTSNEDLKIHLPKADVYFAGSDQIWNCFFQNGKDPAFYLDFAPVGAIKASYAASFSTEDIPEEWKSQVKEWISNLDFISVREKSGVEIIERFGIESVVQVMDPVFLLSKQKWECLAEPLSYQEKYIFLYDFDNNEELGKTVRKLADMNHWKVYSYLPNAYADRCFDQFGPLTFLSLVKNAELIISNSFHATAFSLIFEKNFWVINRYEPINTRMRDLTIMLGVPERLIINLDHELMTDIDYDKIRELLDDEIKKSKEYIEMVLRKAENY